MPIRITGLNSGLDTESIISALVSSYSYKTSKYKKAQTKLSWKQEAWSTLNSKVYSFYNNVGKLKLSSAYNMRTASVSDSTKAKVSAASGATNGVQSLEVLEVAKSDYLTGGKISIKDASGAEDKTKTVSSASTLSELGYTGTGTIEVTNKETGKTTSISVTGDTKISDFVKSLSDAGVKASFDEKNGRLFVSSAKTGTENGFELKSKNADGDKALLALGLAMTSTVSDTGAKVNDDNNWSAASNAKIKLNGAEYTSSTNEFAVNGLSVTALAKTSGEISVTVATDSEGIYEQVKDGIRKLAYSGMIGPDEKLPSVRELASKLAINPNTISKAYKELEQEGFLYSLSGRGTFINPDFDLNDRRKTELFQQFDKITRELLESSVSMEELRRRIETLAEMTVLKETLETSIKERKEDEANEMVKGGSTDDSGK